MAYTHYERLSATDAAFLALEDAAVHMHVGAVAIFDGAPLRRADGGLDFERICDRTRAAMDEVPRFRQRLATVPILEHPVWVDFERFQLAYHVRHTALPPPGDERQLKRLAGRIMSQKLDRGKPLWEMWVVDRLTQGRFALIVKAHHCMVDGIAGMDLLAALLRLEPEAEVPPPRTWVPRPAPPSSRLVRDELGRRLFAPLSVAAAAPSALRRPLETAASLREGLAGVAEAVGGGIAPTSPTPLNPDLGPFRRFDWTSIPLDAVREVRKRRGGTVNDVVLSTVAGAVGRFLRHRGERVEPELVFRAMVPVSVRTEGQRGVPGNRVVNFLARLPVHEQDPVRRLASTIETTRALKASRRVRGSELLGEMSDRTFPSLVVQLVRLASTQRTFNLVVTNVPGPQRPVYFMDAPLTEIYPVVPLFTNQGLGIALFSYDGRLCWGFQADWDALPDLHVFVEGLEQEFGQLRAASGGG